MKFIVRAFDHRNVCVGVCQFDAATYKNHMWNFGVAAYAVQIEIVSDERAENFSD